MSRHADASCIDEVCEPPPLTNGTRVVVRASLSEFKGMTGEVVSHSKTTHRYLVRLKGWDGHASTGCRGDANLPQPKHRHAVYFDGSELVEAKS